MKFNNAKEGPSVSMHGYSIFNETMVDMTWMEIEQAAKEGAIILFPTAGISEHGPHMACGVDTYETYLSSKLIRRELEKKGVKTLIAPPFYWAINERMVSYPGSFSISPEVYKGLLLDVLKNLNGWDFENVFFVSWHSENDMTIMDACKEARRDFGIDARLLIHVNRVRPIYRLTGEEEHVLIMPSGESQESPPKYINMHAGAGEVGFMASFFPGIVDLELAKTLEPSNLTSEDLAKLAKEPDGLGKMVKDGYIGNPADFNAEEGKSSFEEGTVRSATTIEAYMKGSYKLPKGFKPYMPEALGEK